MDRRGPQDRQARAWMRGPEPLLPASWTSPRHVPLQPSLSDKDPTPRAGLGRLIRPGCRLRRSRGQSRIHQLTAVRAPGRGRRRPARDRRSGPAARAMMREGRATHRPAWPGFARVGGRATHRHRAVEAAPGREAAPAGEAAPDQGAAPGGEAAPDQGVAPGGEAAPGRGAAPVLEVAPGREAAPAGGPPSARARVVRGGTMARPGRSMAGRSTRSRVPSCHRRVGPTGSVGRSTGIPTHRVPRHGTPP